MNGMKRLYDFYDLINTSNTLNRLADVSYGDNGLKFGQIHNKMNNIWSYLHPLKEGESEVNLMDYSLIAIEMKNIAVLKEWLKKTHVML